jgi:hypothetical protein
VCLGTPHHGAALERGGNWITVLTELNAYSAPFARLARIRSAGITDLRHGSVSDADWQGRDRFAPGAPPPLVPALPPGVHCFALASTLGNWGTDGLVSTDSALGRHPEPARCLHFTGTALLPDTSHMAQLSSAEVGRQLLAWL